MQPSTRFRLNFSRGTGIEPQYRLNNEAITALFVHGCFQFGASMSGLFLNLYLWRLTQDLTVNGTYNIVVYLFTPLAFAAGGWIAKRKDRMVTYRLGIATIAVFYLLVVIAQEKVAEYYILFAIFNGIAGGFYWTGYLVLMYDVSNESNRLRFLAINMVVFSTAGLIGPALAGFIIQMNEGLQGYILTFLIASIMFVVAAIVSFRIKASPSHHKAYHLRLMGLLMRKERLWLQGLIAFFVMGLFQGIMLFLPNILLLQTVGREDWVGYLGVFFSSLTVITGYIISKKAKKEQARKYVLMTSTGVLIGASFLLFEVHLWTVMLFMIMFSICNPLVGNSLTSYYYRLIGKLPLKGQLRVESVVMREAFLNAGRVVSITLLIVLSKDLDSVWLPIVLVSMAVLQYAMYWLIREESEPKSNQVRTRRKSM
ncbi:MFS transporter [Paenibacillus sepulcri]|uniref:MFS transporter n=2 Tax=Paenibacillus sepulcri TaxID=359917 RepID=A0ABS7C7X9_9BACL|nr:MFS transporter [Paenibacillus sepulcri]